MTMKYEEYIAQNSEEAFQEAVHDIPFDLNQDCYGKINVVDNDRKSDVQGNSIELYEQVPPNRHYINTPKSFIEGTVLLPALKDKSKDSIEQIAASSLENDHEHLLKEEISSEQLVK